MNRLVNPVCDRVGNCGVQIEIQKVGDLTARRRNCTRSGRLTVQVVEHELEELLGAVGLCVHLEYVGAERVPLQSQDNEVEETSELVGQLAHVVVVQHELLQLHAVADLGRQ